MALCAVIGVVVIVFSRAAGLLAAFEPENGTLSGPATVVANSGASNGHGVKFGPPPTPTPTPTPTPSSSPLLGVYAGGPTGDDDAKAAFGRYSDISSTYYQSNQQTLNIAAEEGRIDKGIVPLLTITSKGTTYMQDIADKSGAGWTWMQTYVGSLNTLANYAAARGLPLFATFDHEWEVKVNQGTLTGASTETSVYVAALSNFFALCKTNAPKVTTVYWFGGSDTTAITAVGSALTVQPAMYSIDPYSGPSHSDTETFEAMASPKISWLKSQSWYRGQPIGFSEFGAKHTDAQMAAFYGDLRTHLRNLGLVFGVFFDRDDTNVVQLISGTYPLATQAFAASLAGN